MDVSLSLWLTAAAFVVAIVSLNAVVLFLWRYLYWSERVRDLREQLRHHSSSGQETLRRA
jgi:hypothetical protein